LKTKIKPHRIGFVSLGCAKNLVDSETLISQLEANQIEIVLNPSLEQEIQTVIINTCGFINDAKKESINTILHFINAKKNGDLSRIFVMGCLSQRYKAQLAKELPEVDAFFGVNELKEIIHELGGRYKQELHGERRTTTPSHYTYLKIAEGCDRKCSFCAIPLIRGKHVSRSMEDIIQETEFLVGSGVREINLISQDTTYYGIDLYNKRRLPELMNKLAMIPGLDWLRLHYTYPDGFPLKLLGIIKENPNICKYIDIPLQHISDRILRSMHRNITSLKTRNLIDTIRSAIPGITLRTTMIVGYPGETEQEFNELKRFVGEAKFERMGVFTYSHEEDTQAYSLRDDVPGKLKQGRANELMAIQEEISLEINTRRIGETMKVIIDEDWNGYYIARSEMDSPEVDNEILIKKTGTPLTIGTFCQVKITAAESFDLYAELT